MGGSVALNKAMIIAGICTLFQGAGQMIYAALSLAQYFCIVDFLRGVPLILYIKAMYFHNPSTCNVRITIGPVINGVSNQAFILLTQEPFTAFRTFIINSTNLGLSVFWIITSVQLIMGGARNKLSKHIRWPWIVITVIVCAVDLIATVTYANDTFHTKTLTDIMNFIGGTVSGLGGMQIETTWTAWIMVILYSRFVVLFFLNLLLVITIVVECNIKRDPENVVEQIEAPVVEDNDQRDINEDEDSEPSEPRPTNRIPRPGLSQSFRKMKTLLFKKTPIPEARCRSYSESLEISSQRSPREQHMDVDKKRTVNFPVNLLTLPQRLENLIAEQQRRLDAAVVDTGRSSPPRISQSMPALDTTTQPETSQSRRGTTAELQGQLPWAYIPASAHRMRDQLPPDEDLPPVPLPDYTAIPSFRKASVHRAASSISSLTHKKDFVSSHTDRPPLIQSDVLY